MESKDEPCLVWLRLWFLKWMVTWLFISSRRSIFILPKPDPFSFIYGCDLKLTTLLLYTQVSIHTNTVILSYVSLRFSLNSEHHNHSLVTVIGGEEEHFEDFGESNTSELLLESGVEGTEGEGDSPLVQPPQQVNGSSLLSPRYELVILT